jgi:hypothetical protein
MLRLTAVLTLLAASWGVAQDGTQSEMLPAVRPVRGDLLLWKSSERKAGLLPKEPTPVAPADRLGTRDGDYAVLSAESGAVIALKGVRAATDRGLGIERREKKLVFRVFEGKVAVQTFEKGVKVETPQGQIDADKSYFLVEIEKDKTKVVAIDGELTFTSPLGTVVVESGKETVAEPGKKPAAPRTADLGKATEEFTRHEAASNLIRNPGFEEGLREWGPEHFFAAGKRQTDVENAQAHSGRGCIRLDLQPRLHSKVGVYRFAAQDLTAPVTPGQTYLFRFFIRSDLRQGRVTAWVGLGGIESPDVVKVSCDKSWRMKNAIVTAKDKTLKLQLEVSVETEPCEGSIWIDDFFLAELPTPAKAK